MMFSVSSSRSAVWLCGWPAVQSLSLKTLQKCQAILLHYYDVSCLTRLQVAWVPTGLVYQAVSIIIGSISIMREKLSVDTEEMCRKLALN